MYSYEERMRAVALYIKLGKRLRATIRELGYPTKNALKGWYREHERQQNLPARSAGPLLDKSAGERNPPVPGHTYPAVMFIGMPSAMKRLRTATQIWTSATWRSNSRDISRWPSSLTQFIFVSTLLRRWYPRWSRDFGPVAKL